MPFRERQKLVLASCTKVYDVETKMLENGSVVTESFDQSSKKMPDPKLFDLKYQLKAGINLEEVNSKVLGVSSIDADAYLSKFVESKKNNEVNNKNNEVEVNNNEN